MVDTVSKDVKRRAPRPDLARGAVASEAAVSSYPPRVCVTCGSSPENPGTALASR
jgi:hypothetical protein